MNKKLGLFKVCAAIAVAAFFVSGCSDDSSASCAGSCVDSGDTIEITVPDHKDSVIIDRKWDAEDAVSSSSVDKPASSADKLASSSSAKAPESSSAPASSSEKAPESSSAPESSAAKTESSSSVEEAEDWRDYCLKAINAKRATEDLAPLVRANEEREACVIQQAADDMAMNKGHGNFGNCKESAQNSGPNINPKWYKTEKEIVDTYVNMMWDDEKKLVTSGERDPNKDSDYSYIGHYLNMKNTRYTSVACGIAYSEDGSKAWFNMNFY